MEKNNGNNDHQSLFNFFKSGEQVIRFVRNDQGIKEKYEGTIIAMNDKELEIYWHTLDGVFCPDRIKNRFTICEKIEVFKGKSNQYSPIERKKPSLYYYWNSLY
jgi:hypothetical protein